MHVRYRRWPSENHHNAGGANAVASTPCIQRGTAFHEPVTVLKTVDFACITLRFAWPARGAAGRADNTLAEPMSISYKQ
jgi:hypothetical protein